MAGFPFTDIEHWLLLPNTFIRPALTGFVPQHVYEIVINMGFVVSVRGTSDDTAVGAYPAQVR